MTDRCETYDLPKDQCAHCRGAELPDGMTPDWTTTNPERTPRAVPLQEVEREPQGLGFYPVPVLNELSDLYPRLFGELPAGSKKGNPAENSAGFGSAPDPRRAPVRVEVHDLIAEIEREVPDLSRWACQTLSLTACVVAPVGSDRGRSGELDPRVQAAMDTLSHYWPALAAQAGEMAHAIEDRLVRLICKARRMLGQTAAPVPLASPCPECREFTVFRLETERGSIAVCSNPVDLDEWGEKRQWTETEWEDAHYTPRFVTGVSTASNRGGQRR